MLLFTNISLPIMSRLRSLLPLVITLLGLVGANLGLLTLGVMDRLPYYAGVGLAVVISVIWSRLVFRRLSDRPLYVTFIAGIGTLLCSCWITLECVPGELSLERQNLLGVRTFFHHWVEGIVLLPTVLVCWWRSEV